MNNMINSNVYNNGERIIKGIMPCSPSNKRKNTDLNIHSPPNTINDYSRKDMTPVSPQPYIKQHKNNDYSHQQHNLQSFVRELGEKIVKISQKISQHESILIKITENSLQNNKEQYKKGNQNRGQNHKISDPILENVNRLKKQFEDYRSNNPIARQLEYRTQYLTDQLHKTQNKLRQQIQTNIRRLNQQPLKVTSNFNEERIDQIEKNIRKIQKGIALNSGKITGAYDIIESINSSIDGHMDLVNAEVNKAISKIVAFVNDKISKPLTENIDKLTRRVEEIENQAKIVSHSVSHFGNLKSSSTKSIKQMTKAQYRQTLSAYGSEIIISQNTYYIDIEGYLLDREFFYLVDAKEERIRLDEKQIQLLMSQRMFD